MKSEFRLIAPSFKLTFTVGLFATIIVLTLALIYKFETSLILLATAATIGGAGVVMVVGRVYALSHNKEVARLDLAERQQKLRMATYQADRAELESRIISIPKTQRILVDPDAPIRVIEAAPESYQVLPAAQAQAAPSVDLLGALDNVQRCLIVGASDSGKTTLLQWLVARRLAVSKVVVIDPHAYPNKWPGGCVVIGTGRNYTDIDHALTGLVQLMSKRYTDIGAGVVGEGQHDKITILVDEWRSLTFNIKSAGDTIKALLCESRKAAISVFVASHSERVKPLGIEGEGDLKDGFAVVRLTIVNGQRLATLDTGSGEVPAILPGLYYRPTPGQGQGQGVGFPDPLDYTDLTDPQPTPTEAHILTLHRAGESLNEISRQLWGSSGGYQVNQIKNILAKFSM